MLPPTKSAGYPNILRRSIFGSLGTASSKSLISSGGDFVQAISAPRGAEEYAFVGVEERPFLRELRQESRAILAEEARVRLGGKARETVREQRPPHRFDDVVARGEQVRVDLQARVLAAVPGASENLGVALDREDRTRACRDSEGARSLRRRAMREVIVIRPHLHRELPARSEHAR